jgi:hypothetical protein
MIRRLFPLIIIMVLAISAISCGGGNAPAWPDGGQNTGRQTGYDLLFPSKIVRWDASAFPINVYITAPPHSGSDAAKLLSTAKEALSTWDGQIEGMPVLFRYVDGSASYDIIVNWQDDTPGAYTVATDKGDRIVIRKIAINQNLIDPEQVKPLLAHELGHVLGLGHSKIRGDLMYPAIVPGTTELTERDHYMIAWLYANTSYVPIRTY